MNKIALRPFDWKESPRRVHTPTNNEDTTTALEDPDSVWPQKVVKRRNLLRDILNRYTEQLLHGCSEPNCQTRTCLIFQRRTAKRPFRPYTALSARALAVALVSQDHPEKGLCPHLPTKQASDISRLASQSNVSTGETIQSPVEDQKQPSLPKVVFGATSDSDRLMLERYAGYSNDNEIDEAIKSKDHKSFAQSLFDTIPMKTLDTNDTCPSSSLKPMIQSSNDGMTNNADRDAEVTGSQQQSKLPLPATALHRKRSDSNVDEQGMMGRWRCSESTLNTKNPSSSVNKERPQWHWDDGIVRGFEGEKAPLNPGRSVTHFSPENILGMWHLAYKEDQRRDARMLLRFLDRSNMALDSAKLECQFGVEQPQQIAFIRQATSYVCSTSHALLRSFMTMGVTTSIGAAHTFYSIPLPVITDSLYRIHKIIDPSTMLSSLWISAGKVFLPRPEGTHTPRIDRNNEDDEASCSGSSNCQLNDSEAAHIVKIVFAALVALNPVRRLESIVAVHELRKMGQIATSDTSLRDRHSNSRSSATIDELSRIMDSFENELAVALVLRLIKALVSRQNMGRWKRRLERKEHWGQKKDFMTMVMDCLMDTDGHEVFASEEHALNYQHCRGGTGMRHSVPGHGIPAASLCQHLFLVVTWMHTILIKEWDGKVEIPRYGAVAGALEFLKHMYQHCDSKVIVSGVYELPLLLERLDVVDMPIQWANHATDPDKVHLLSYPFLFSSSIHVAYFRAINHHAMSKAFEQALVNTELVRRLNYANHDHPSSRGKIRLTDRLRAPTNKYLVLDIRRGKILEDAMDQLWRREPFELMKPLKIRMGMDEGEEGVDHGGVQQEFFRLAIAEALDPKYGAFTTDTTTRMTWFQPLSAEPIYKFELIGLLTSLAIYNGLTLPFTFPTAFYRKLCGLPVTKLEEIKDGWPELAKGLQALLDWTEGDVEDIFMRSYVFSIDNFGTTVDIDMDARRRGKTRRAKDRRRFINDDEQIAKQSDNADTKGSESGSDTRSTSSGEIASSTKRKFKSPSKSPQFRPTESIVTDLSLSPSPNPASDITTPAHSSSSGGEQDKPKDASISDPSMHRPDSPTLSTPMVTNANRHQYVRDYIEHLTTISIAPQFAAFSAGFHRCLNRKSTTLFTVDTLKLLIEGTTTIDTRALQSITRYEGGFNPNHKTIKQFWNVVHEWGDSPPLERNGDEGDDGDDDDNDNDSNSEGQQKVRKLLEFVTASDRLPVGGVNRVTFVVQKNGVGDERLPTSLTCFGRLLLPEFSGEEALRQGLGRAVEEARGFGVP